MKSKCHIEEGVYSGRNILIVEPGTNAEMLILLFSSSEIFWLFKTSGHLSKLITEVEWCNLSTILRNIICRWLLTSVYVYMTHCGDENLSATGQTILDFFLICSYKFVLLLLVFFFHVLAFQDGQIPDSGAERVM